MQRQTLHTFLDNEIAEYGLDPKLSQLIINISETCKEISFEVSCGDVAGVLGVARQTCRAKSKSSWTSSVTT